MVRTIHRALGATLMIASLNAVAQRAPVSSDDRPATSTRPVTHPAPDREDLAILWSEDFANGLPDSWTVQDASGFCAWRYSLDGSYGYFNGNDGASGGEAIASTSAANGFLIADNDSANNAVYGQPSSTNYHYLATYFTTPAIDLSGHPNVKLEFEQFFRYNNAPTLDVMVSHDGVNWTTWDAKGNVLANEASENANKVSINISDVAGDEATVYVKIGWSSRVYYWMIDDIRIVEAPENDLRLTGAWYNEWFFDTADDFGGLEYSIYPSSQVRALRSKGKVSNEGSTTAADVTFTTTINDANGDPVHTSTAVLSDALASLSNDSLYGDEWTPPSAPGKYTVNFSVSDGQEDATPEDNTRSKTFRVADKIFARDQGIMTGTEDDQGGGYRLGNWFNIVNEGDLLYGVDVAINNATPADLIIYTQVLDGNREVIAESQDYVVLQSDRRALGDSAFTTIPFVSPVPLDAGSDYLVVVGHYGGADGLEVGNSGVSEEQSSLLWSDTQNDWFYVTRTPMVRMNMDANLSVAEIGAGTNAQLAQNMPNPADANTTIAYTLRTAAKVTIDVFDLNGRSIMSHDAGRVSAGMHRWTMDTQALPAGLYTYRLNVDGATLSQRMAVVH